MSDDRVKEVLVQLATDFGSEIGDDALDRLTREVTATLTKTRGPEVVEWDVSLSNTFEARTPEEAVARMAHWLAAGRAIYESEYEVTGPGQHHIMILTEDGWTRR
jgi:hypothetical protein